MKEKIRDDKRSGAADTAPTSENNRETHPVYETEIISSKSDNTFKIILFPEDKKLIYELFRPDLNRLGVRWARALKGYVCAAHSKEKIDLFLKSKNIKAEYEGIFDEYYTKSSRQKLIADEQMIVEKKRDRLQEKVAEVLTRKAHIQIEVEAREIDHSNPAVAELLDQISKEEAQLKEDDDSIKRSENIVHILENSEQIPPVDLPAGYFFQGKFLTFQPEPKSSSKEEEEIPSPIRVCSKLEITAITRDDRQQNFGRLLEFNDPDGHCHEWSMPMELLAGSGEEYRRCLLSMGLIIEPGTNPRYLLTRYIQSCTPKESARCVAQTGWYGQCFVLPDGVIGSYGGERVLLQSSSFYAADFSTRGSLEDWKRTVGRLCRGNSRLIFSISLAFAAPLLEILEIEGGGFHLIGASSVGKTTALNIASSVWGEKSYLKTWRMTDNALEAVCASHNHTLLALDELSQYDPEKAGSAAYLIANGQSKGRLTAHSSLQKPASWRLLFLSSGEVALAVHAAEAGKKSRAGQEVRMIDIPADTGKYGLFEELHGHLDGASLSKELKEAAFNTYGTPSRVFLEILSKEKNAISHELKKRVRTLVHDFINQTEVSGQVHRVAERFALVAVAGELATHFGITGWDKGFAEWAARECFYAWLRTRGTTGNREEILILAQIRLFFQQHAESRFSPWKKESSSKTINRAGYRRLLDDGTEEFYVFPDVFKSEICQGHELSAVIKICLEDKYLRSYSERDTTHPVRLPGKKSTARFYVFSSRVLGGEE